MPGNISSCSSDFSRKRRENRAAVMSNYRLLRGRFSIDGQYYHINTTTDFRRSVFSDFACARIVVLAMRELEVEKVARTFCFVIMTNHVHWLMQLGQEQSLGTAVKLLKGRTARRINQLKGMSGSLWQSSYFERTMRSTDDLLAVGRYIIENPLRAGLVTDLSDYPHWDGVWLQEMDEGGSD